MMVDIPLALLAVQTQSTETLDAFPTKPVTKEAEELQKTGTEKAPNF